MIRLLLVDDHELIRTGLRRILEGVPNIRVVGEAASGEEAIQWLKQHSVDLALMDMSMPGIGGLEATRRMLQHYPQLKIIILTIWTENPLPEKLMNAGAVGYLSKNVPSNEMIEAIQKVAMGQRYIAPVIAQQMVLHRLNSPTGGSPLSQLSERELQIMLMITQGEKPKEIAEQLHVSVKTVNTYRYRIFAKLQVDSDVEMTHFALRHGLLNS